MNTTAAPTHPAIYLRISKDRDDDRLGVERQRQDCEALVESRGWPTAALYTDNDVSAYSGRKRPEYERLLGDLKDGKVDAVIAQHPDRLHRSPKELEAFIDIVEYHQVRVETVQMRDVLDLSTPSGRAVARTMGVFARFESEHKAERQRRKHLELATNGNAPTTGTRPFGYTLDWSELVHDEATLIREAADRILAGDSLRGICMDWNDREIPTTTGGRWQQWPLRRMLTSARNAGIRELFGYEADGHGGQRRCTTGKRIGQGNWPAIIDEVTLERLRAILRDPSRRTTSTNARSYLLSGYLVCSECQHGLVARPRVDKVRRYVCASGPMFNGCGKIAILAEPLEELIAEAVVQRIDSPAVADAMNEEPETDRGAEAAALAADRAKLAELAKMYANDEVTLAEWGTMRKTLAERIEARADHLAQGTSMAVLDGLRGAGGDVRAAWEAQGFDQRRAIIGAVVDRIVIGAAVRGRNRFDSDRVGVEWRM